MLLAVLWVSATAKTSSGATCSVAEFVQYELQRLGTAGSAEPECALETGSTCGGRAVDAETNTNDATEVGRTCTPEEMCEMAAQMEVGAFFSPPHGCTPMQAPAALEPEQSYLYGAPAPDASFLQSAREVRIAHVRVVTSYEEWCAAPCDKISWERAAPKPSLDSSMRLFEIAHWKQENRITLYEFPSTFARELGDVWNGVRSAREVREQYALLSFPSTSR